MATPHISASKGDIAPITLVPGDPLRAQYIARNFLQDTVQVNAIRNMLGYTGTFNGQPISVFASGMGMPSMGIYAYELFQVYGVETIIRVGSCGSYAEHLKLGDVILAHEAFSESTFAKVQSGESQNTLLADQVLNAHIEQQAQQQRVNLHCGAIHSSDVFYRQSPEFPVEVGTKSLLAVEMEAFALFATAKMLGKSAAALLTVTDSMVTGESVDAKAREMSLNDMITLALNSAQTWKHA